MLILAADTSTSINTVGLWDCGRLRAETVAECGRAHSERLLATVDWVLREAGCGLPDIDLLAISIGPGSFTGLRVGAATWKGLALAVHKPLIGVPTLDAMTRLSHFEDAAVCPLLDARMGEIFGAFYRFTSGVREKVVPDSVCPIERLVDQTPADTLFYGNGAELYKTRILEKRPESRFLEPVLSIPRASAVAAEAAALAAAGADTDAGRVAPVYLRKSQAEENRAKAARHD